MIGMLGLFLGIIMAVGPSSWQAEAAKPSAPQTNSQSDVIVEGYRQSEGKLPAHVHWNYASLYDERIKRERADIFLSCALRLSDPPTIKKIVDGVPNSASARFAQGLLIKTHGGCYPSTGLDGSAASSRPDSTIDFGESIIDHGIIVEYALKTYAPNFSLTRASTTDPAVRSRFVQREKPRNRLRFKNDLSTLEFAICLVDHQPVQATALLKSDPGSKLEQVLMVSMIDQGTHCLKNARTLAIDPTWMRAYVADAFYRWAVATLGVNSLIPSE